MQGLSACNRCDQQLVYCVPEASLHLIQVNTTAVVFATKAMNHVEGGWPKEVDYTEAEHVIRYRKKVGQGHHSLCLLHPLLLPADYAVQQLAHTCSSTTHISITLRAAIPANTCRPISVCNRGSSRGSQPSCRPAHPRHVLQALILCLLWSHNVTAQASRTAMLFNKTWC